jgi:bifunctional polynucleotide phosphatase/kinase
MSAFSQIKDQHTFNIKLNNFSYRSKMAGFDYDGTLVKPKSNSTFSKDENDWKWLRPNVPQILTEIYKKGYAIVIFTNQSKTQAFKIKQIYNVFSSLKLPVNIFIETDKPFKKPNPNMYNLYTDKRAKVNKAESFYVGDALGRPGDFADSDKQFAINSGIQYISPEQMFPFTKIEASLIPIPKYREIVLMMGYPGSGKSSYAEKAFKDHPYIIIHGDDYKSESALKKAFKSAIETIPDKSIILDATHSNKKKRQIFIEIAQKADIPIRLIHLTTSIEESMHRNLQREKPVPKIALYLYRKNFEEPEQSEGLYEIINIS